MAEEKNIPGVATEKESDEVLEEIRTQTKEVLKELLAVAKMKPGQILVVGCSSSEIGVTRSAPIPVRPLDRLYTKHCMKN